MGYRDARAVLALRRRGQAMLELGLMLPLLLFAVAGMLDLQVAFQRDGAVIFATAYAASRAADGRPSAEVQDAAVQLAQGVLRSEDVTVAPCWQRLVPGLPTTVRTSYYFRPLTPVLELFWRGLGRLDTPIVHTVTLPTATACSL